MKKYITVIAASAMTLNLVNAATIVDWDGLAGTSVSGTSFDVNVTAGALTRGAGVVENTGANFNTRNWDTGSDFATALTADDYLIFTITVASGFQLSNIVLSAELDRSGSGPTTVAWAIDTAGGDAFTQIGADVVTPDPGAVVTSDTLAGPVTGTVSFGIIGWGASSAAGTMDIEDDLIGGTTGLRISGDVSLVPEPSSTAFIGLAGFAALLRRRR